MLEKLRRYIADNPRRLLIRRLYPDLFQRVNILLGETEPPLVLSAYGNINLLKDPCITPLIVSSRYTPEERAEWERRWNETARCGGVFVSPFISPKEAELRDRYLEEGARIIHVVGYGFPERFKPAEREFNLCAEGKLLLVTPAPTDQRDTTMTRAQALSLNALARRLAQASESGWRLRRPQRR